MASKKVSKKTRKLSKAKWASLVQDKIYDEQFKLIKEQYGFSVAESANYGWGVAGNTTYMDVATKVYVREIQVLSSTASYPSLEIDHDWSDYTS